MIQSDALQQVRSRLDETTATVWTDKEIYQWINEAVAEIARRTEALELYVLVDVAAGTTGVTMPTDILRVNRVEWQVDSLGNQLIPLEIRERSGMDAIWGTTPRSTQGTPAYITFTQFPPRLQAQLYPVPEAAGQLNIGYYTSPAPLATDGSAGAVLLQIPTGWEDLILDYAVQAAQRRDGNASWQDTRQVFEAKLEQMWNMVQFYHNQPGNITPDVNGWEPEYWPY